MNHLPPEQRNGIEINGPLSVGASPIQRFYAKTVILITGATGFLGKLLVEKLLRTCHDLEKIFILIRPKKGKTCKTRFDEYFSDVIFDRLKLELPDAIRKIVFITGDCALPNLGLNEDDVKRIILEVNCIFHLAATVRFNEKIRTAAYINVRATRDLLQITTKVKSLKAFVYVSTAFSFCPKETIDEVFYKPPLKPEALIALVDALNDETLDSIAPTLLGKWPNTYAFTKAVAEDLLNRREIKFPIAMVRPSIVTVTAKEPVNGWTSNYYGATGCFVALLMGVLRTIHCDGNNPADIVPADYVVNNIIAAAWDAGHGTNRIRENPRTANTSRIYNYISGSQNPITWKQFIDLSIKHIGTAPYLQTQWHCFITATPNKFLYLTLHYVLHIFPAYIADHLSLCLGKQPRLIQMYKRLEETMDLLVYFTTHKWNFRNRNTQVMWKKLDRRDKNLFEFDVEGLNWDTYFYSYVIGVRRYLIKDPLDTVPKAKQKLLMLKIAHYGLMFVFLLTVSSALLRLLSLTSMSLF